VNENYQRVKALFQERNYREVIESYQRATTRGSMTFDWWLNDCGIFAALAYAYVGDYPKAIEAFHLFMKKAPCRKPQLALQKCGPVFIVRLGERKPANWSELWYQLRHQMAPIEALVEDLWSPDLEYKNETLRQPIYDALREHGQEAIPALLNALAINDWNAESREQEVPYPKIALANIGVPAFEALESVIFSPPKIKVCGNVDTRMGRAAIKMLWRFGDDRAEPVLRRALADPAVRYKDYVKDYVKEELEHIELRRQRKLDR